MSTTVLPVKPVDTVDKSVLPTGLLTPFHEVRESKWDEASGTGRIVTVRKNRFDDWFYACHFLTDPVMPGCWGLDAVWQTLRHFAGQRGLPACKPLGMEGVSFFGQIRPYDKEVVYTVDILSLEKDGADFLLTGKATVTVDGVPVYSIDSAQVGTAFWESDGAAAPALPPARTDAYTAPLTWAQFKSAASFSAPEIVAMSRGSLVSDAPNEMPLLPDSLMLEVGDVRRITAEPAELLATRANAPTEWFFSMNGGVKPAALLVDGVWQLTGVYHAWSGSAGTGRALGFERVEFHGDVSPNDGDIVYHVRIVKTFRAPTGDMFIRADAEVYAGARKVMTIVNANVGCHKNIRYADYPLASAMSTGGKLKIKE